MIKEDSLPPSGRRIEPELMDDPGIPPDRHRRALAGLARLNRVAESAEILWPSIAAIAARAGGAIRVLDAATGSGDIPVALALRARRDGLEVAWSGCDISEVALAAARERADAAGVDVRFFKRDLLDGPPDETFDVVMSSLFLHHLDHGEAVMFLSYMKSASSRLVLVQDLRRCVFGSVLTHCVPRVLTRSRVVHVDAVRSARAAFTVEEAAALASAADLAGARIARRWPARFLLEWTR